MDLDDLSEREHQIAFIAALQTKRADAATNVATLACRYLEDVAEGADGNEALANVRKFRQRLRTLNGVTETAQAAYGGSTALSYYMDQLEVPGAD